MSETTPDLQESIRLALEAAEAANDASNEVETIRSKTEQSADRIDKFSSTMKPLMIGTLAGAVITMGLGGLVYMRTLSEMRRATGTQLEALTMFASRVEQVDAQLTALGAVTDTLTMMQGQQAEAFTAMQEQLNGMGAKVAEEIGFYSEQAGDLKGQLVQTVSETVTDTVEANHTKTRDALTAGLSDLQLALTRMMADVVARPPEPATAASKPAPAPTKPRTVTTKSRSTPAPKVQPNPFKYP